MLFIAHNKTKKKKGSSVETKFEVQPYLTKKEIAVRLRCTTRNIDNWMNRGLPYIPFGKRRTLFVAEEVDKFMAELVKQK